MLYIRGKRLTALLLALVLILGAAACGAGGNEEDASPLSGTVYVPEFIDVDVGMEHIQGGCSDGKNLYLAGRTARRTTTDTTPSTGCPWRAGRRWSWRTTPP